MKKEYKMAYVPVLIEEKRIQTIHLKDGYKVNEFMYLWYDPENLLWNISHRSGYCVGRRCSFKDALVYAQKAVTLNFNWDVCSAMDPDFLAQDVKGIWDELKPMAI